MPADGALIVTNFDGSSPFPLTIGDTTIRYVFTPESDGYYKFGIAADEGGFGRYQDSATNCYYWFHSSDADGFDGMTINLLETYHTTYARAGSTKDTSGLVDGAAWGDDNFISYFNEQGQMVAVLRLGFTEDTENVSVLSMAYDADGLSFGEGIRAASAIPEPTLGLLGLIGSVSLLARRRRSLIEMEG